MKIIVDKRSAKDLAALKIRALDKKVALYIGNVIQAAQLSDIKNVKKLTGFETFYRIRTGDYRSRY